MRILIEAATGPLERLTGELRAEVRELADRLAVTKPAVQAMLRDLGEQDLPLEQLPDKLAEIAQRHKAMLARLAVLDPEDAASRERIEEARAAIEAGEYERADRLLSAAEDAELAAVRTAEELARQAQEAADKHRLNAAATRAERGELSLTRLDYGAAAGHLKKAEELAPTSQPKLRADYLMRAGEAFRDGVRFGRAQGQPVVWSPYAANLLGQARELLERAVDVLEAELGRGDPALVKPLLRLALLHRDLWRGPLWPHESWWRYHDPHHAAAKGLLQRALTIQEEAFGEDHVQVAGILVHLGGLQLEKGANDTDRYGRPNNRGALTEAEELLRQAVSIYEGAADLTEDPEYVEALTELARVHRVLLILEPNRFDEAEKLLMQAIELRKEQYGEDHPLVANSYNDLGLLYTEMVVNVGPARFLVDKGKEAFIAALEIWANLLPQPRPIPSAAELTTTLNLAYFYGRTDQPARAAEIYKRTLEMLANYYGQMHPALLPVLDGFASLEARRFGRYSDRRFHHWSDAIRRQFGYPPRP